MKVKNEIRKALFAHMDSKSIDRFYSVYYRIKYPKDMSRKCTFGNLNSQTTFYIIRPRTDGTEGLMSLFMNVAKNLYYANEHGYEAVIDFKNYHTQYDDIVNGETNAWNFYFTQPTKVSLEEIYKSKNVILSGLEIQRYRPDMFIKTYNNENLRSIHDFIFRKIKFNDKVLDAVKKEIMQMGICLEHTLGLYLRGTDYIALKPSGHPVQPTVVQAVEVVENFKKKYPINTIFLVTEDGSIYREIKKRYGDECVIVSYDTFINNYKGKRLIAHDKSICDLNESPYLRGLNYLVKIIILSKCAYFVGGDTMGAWAACVFSEECFADKHVFDLGIYGK